VRRLGHVGTAEHNALNASARLVLNISREGMARFGFSPATRVFEAAGAGACLVTDAWQGVEQFFEPGEEILVARDGREVAELTRSITFAKAREIGLRALERARDEHTYARRAEQFERIFEGAIAA
jgi:spore maturation protein CgeB